MGHLVQRYLFYLIFCFALTEEVDVSQNWSNQMAQGRLQTPSVQDDFLLQMLQVNELYLFLCNMFICLLVF